MGNAATSILPSMLVVVFAVSTLTWLDAASAEPTVVDKENARALWLEGIKRREERDLRGSLMSFRAAHAIMGIPSTGIEVAKAEEALGLLVEARDTALQVAKMPVSVPEDERAREEARELFETLGSRIPTIAITVKGAKAGAKVRIHVDEVELPEVAAGLPRRTNPGSHVVTAQAQGYRAARQVITVAESSVVGLELMLEPSTGAFVGIAPTASAQKPSDHDFWSSPAVERLGWIGMGAGATGLIAGAVTGGIAIRKHADLTSSCPSATCPPEQEGNVRVYEAFALSSTIGLLVGTALAAGGIGLLFAHNTKTPRRTSLRIALVAPGVAATGATLRVLF